jgi:hypothetical protein
MATRGAEDSKLQDMKASIRSSDWALVLSEPYAAIIILSGCSAARNAWPASVNPNKRAAAVMAAAKVLNPILRP